MTENLRLEYRDAAELTDNESNWREHPAEQIESLEAALAEVGWAGALLYNERTSRLIDGHARKKVSKGKVPVLIGSWSEEQEKLILATLDPLAAMATANAEKLEALLAEVSTGSEALMAMLSNLAEQNKIIPADAPDEFPEPDESVSHECPKCGYQWA